MTMASWQLFFNIFHCCSVSEMFFRGCTLGKLLDYIIVKYDYDYVYVSMAFPTAAFPRVQRKMVIVILHAGAPPKNAKIQKPNFAATISYSQCTWSILQCPVLGSNSCSNSVRRRDHLLQEDCGRNGNDLDQESQHTSSSRVVSGFWDNSQWPESGLVLNYSLRKTLKNSAHVQYAPYPLEEVLATIGRLKSIQAFGRGSSHCPIWILQSPRCVRMRWSLGRTFSSTMEHLVRFRCVGWWWRVEEASVAWRCLT